MEFTQCGQLAGQAWQVSVAVKKNPVAHALQTVGLLHLTQFALQATQVKSNCTNNPVLHFRHKLFPKLITHLAQLVGQAWQTIVAELNVKPVAHTVHSPVLVQF